MSDGPIEKLLHAIDPDADDGTRASNFARGLALGALVGAAIAGSTIWQRRQARPIKPPDGEGPVALDPPK